jgi:MFS family permease
MAPLTIQRYVQVARRPAFRRFWLGMMISRAGDAFTTVALAWVVLDIAGPLQLGVVLMCFGLPRVVSGPIAGRVLDRPDPRLLLAADNAVRGLFISVVPVLLWLHHLVVVDLYGIAVASALCSAVTEVAEAGLVPRMVDDEHLEGANSMLAANWELAAIAGPVVSGVIVATIGAGLALLLDAVSFAVMSALCLTLPAFRAARTVNSARPGPRAAGRNWLGLGILFRLRRPVLGGRRRRPARRDGGTGAVRPPAAPVADQRRDRCRRPAVRAAPVGAGPARRGHPARPGHLRLGAVLRLRPHHDAAARAR